MYQPVIPMGGLAGWRFLQQTYDTQFEAFSKSTELKRDTDYFRDNIGAVSTAEDLVSDRRLLSVTLGAFGLQDDINNRFFIQKMLEEGTTNEDALANRFTDPRYKEMSEAFGFGPGEYLKTGEAGFVDAIINRFETSSFEVAAGEQDESMRIALYAQHEVAELAGADKSNDAKWFTLMGDPPMRALFEKALNLPSSIGQIDVDQQLGVFKDRAQAVFGTDQLADFANPEMVEDLITKYVVRNQIASFSAGMTGQSIALTLLQS